MQILHMDKNTNNILGGTRPCFVLSTIKKYYLIIGIL